MTTSLRGDWPRLVAALALALFAWTHRNAFGMSGFADDLGLLVDFSERAREGSLLQDVLTHISQPLWPGSTMWRPLPYASFALDSALWGADAGLWRITNLALHVASACVAGLLCIEMTKHARAGAVGFASFLLIPWSPEVAIWLVGRFDGWATLSVLLALLAALRSSGFDRWWAVSLVAGACAYASKESALILPLWVAVVSLYACYRAASGAMSLTTFFGAALRQRGSLLLAHTLLAAAYLLWRAKLFSTSALNVYSAAPQLGLPQLATQFWAHMQFPLGLGALAPAAAWVVGICVVSLVVIAWGGKQRLCGVTGIIFIVMVVAAVATYFSVAPGEGDGYRLYYLATIGFALVAASASTSTKQITPVVITVLLAAMAIWQAQVTDEWQRASVEMKASEAAIRRAASSLPIQDYGLALLPDHLGHVPFSRNAQGALPKLAGRPTPSLDVLGKLVVFTPPQIDEWHRLVQEDVVRKITFRSDAPPNPTQYFCFDSRTQNLQRLGFWPPGTLEEWRRKWRESVDRMCPAAAASAG